MSDPLESSNDFFLSYFKDSEIRFFILSFGNARKVFFCKNDARSSVLLSSKKSYIIFNHPDYTVSKMSVLSIKKFVSKFLWRNKVRVNREGLIFSSLT